MKKFWMIISIKFLMCLIATMVIALSGGCSTTTDVTSAPAPAAQVESVNPPPDNWDQDSWCMPNPKIWKDLSGSKISGVIGWCCFDEQANTVILVDKYRRCWKLWGCKGKVYYSETHCSSVLRDWDKLEGQEYHTQTR